MGATGGFPRPTPSDRRHRIVEAKTEPGERRDVGEFVEVVRAIGADPYAVMAAER